MCECVCACVREREIDCATVWLCKGEDVCVSMLAHVSDNSVTIR